MAHRNTYLFNHLYYLINPVDAAKFAFITFRPSVATRATPLRIFKNGKYVDWGRCHTYFREQDIILIMSCLSIIFPDSSVFHDLSYGKDVSGNINFDLSNLQNVNALKLNGNELEVFATVTLLESSHHQRGSIISSFAGQSVKSFLCNITCNLLQKWEHGVNY